MSDLNESSVELIDKINRMVDAAFDEGVLNAPEVISDILFLSILSNSLIALIAMVVVALSCCVAWRAHKDDCCDKVFIVYLSCIPGFVGLIFFITSCYGVIKASLTPKVFLLEYAANLF